MVKKGKNSGSFRSKPNTVVKDLHTSKYRQRVVQDKRRGIEDGQADQEIEDGLEDHEDGENDDNDL